MSSKNKKRRQSNRPRTTRTASLVSTTARSSTCCPACVHSHASKAAAVVNICLSTTLTTSAPGLPTINICLFSVRSPPFAACRAWKHLLGGRCSGEFSLPATPTSTMPGLFFVDLYPCLRAFPAFAACSSKARFHECSSGGQ
uniref:Uncharacterized protein n=1 Tax=Dunaliella tertiolecta TaxID=3047 RepID=A0A7S3QP85_DUNTE